MQENTMYRGEKREEKKILIKEERKEYNIISSRRQPLEDQDMCRWNKAQTKGV